MGRCIYLRKGEVHTAPVVGIKASDLPIGQIVKLMEGGVETEFIVVNQGIPENSSLYDASCNGTWLLRKNLKSGSGWATSNNNSYAVSAVNALLNGNYFNGFGTVEQTVIKQVKIPYVNGTGSGGSVASGVSGLPAKVFLLSGYELGWTTGDSNRFPEDGAKLDYFESSSAGNSKRAAGDNWWTRSPYTGNATQVWYVTVAGVNEYNSASLAYDVRPTLIIPSTSIFDPTTYLLKK